MEVEIFNLMFFSGLFISFFIFFLIYFRVVLNRDAED